MRPIGDRVYVETVLFSGWGTVTNYYPSEPFFPIEVTLDEGDKDSGHRIKRVSKDEIVMREGVGE